MNNDRIIPRAENAGLVTFKVFSDNTRIPEEFRLLSIVVEEGANRIGIAELELHDGSAFEEDFPISNSPIFELGKKIRIEAGYDSEDDIIFEGIVVKHGIQTYMHKPSMLKIECKHEAVKMTIQRKSFYYYEQSDSAIIEEVCNRYGLEPDVESTSFQHPEVVQFYSNDWDFIVSRAQANGMLVYTEGKKVLVKKPVISGGASVLDLRFGGNVKDFEAEIDARYQYSSVKSFSWDAAAQELVESPGEAPTNGLHPETKQSPLAGVIGLEAYELRHGGQLKPEEMQTWASAQHTWSSLAMVRGFVSFDGYKQKEDGSNQLKPGELIQLAGMGERFNGLAFVSAIRHTISTEGWDTHVTFGLSPKWFHEQHEDIIDTKANGLLPAINGLHIAKVTQLEEDPEGEDRVLVRIPMIDINEQGTWARVATLDAGEERGTFFRPEIGDEVVLGFLNDDPRNPVILGMLHSSNKPAPLRAEDVNHEKGYVSRSKMKLIFNDEKKSVILETPVGKKFTMDEDQDIIQLEDQHGNKILMNPDGITIETPGKLTMTAQQDMVAEGLNVNVTANAQLTAEGTAGAELSSSGQTVVKGSMVMIN